MTPVSAWTLVFLSQVTPVSVTFAPWIIYPSAGRNYPAVVQTISGHVSVTCVSAPVPFYLALILSLKFLMAVAFVMPEKIITDDELAE